jgi:hypothetical protein
VKQGGTLNWIAGGLVVLAIVALSLLWRGYPRQFDLSWEEEVRLSDGRIVVIGRSIKYERLDRWSRYESAISRKEELIFTPEGESQPRQVSFPNLELLTFDAENGVNYIVLTATSGRSGMPEHSPYPVGEPPGDYRVLRWSGNGFARIPLKDLPASIVDANLLWNTSARVVSLYAGSRLGLPVKEQMNREIAGERPRNGRLIVR